MVKKILVIVAHPDDEILGVGGTIKKHTNAGDETYCLILGQGILSRDNSNEKEISNLREDSLMAGKTIGFKEVFFENVPDQRSDSVDFLDIVKIIERYFSKIRPDVVYTHYENDLNLDHRITFRSVITASRPCNENSPSEIYSFEVLSSTEWQLEGEKFKPNTYVNIETEIDAKVNALKIYTSEIREYPHPRSKEGIIILAQYRGLECNKKYAEAFKLIRSIK